MRRRQDVHVCRDVISLCRGLRVSRDWGMPSNLSSNVTLPGRRWRISTYSPTWILWTIFPGIGGIADASTNGSGTLPLVEHMKCCTRRKRPQLLKLSQLAAADDNDYTEHKRVPGSPPDQVHVYGSEEDSIVFCLSFTILLQVKTQTLLLLQYWWKESIYCLKTD